MVNTDPSLVNGKSSHQQSLNPGSMNSLASFIVLDEGSLQPMSDLPSLSSDPQSLPSSLTPDELQTKLQKIIKENAELKDVLQQNNLAMKQQFETLSSWHNEVLQVHKSHKDKFEEMKSLIVKLKAEKEGLLKKLQNQPNVESIASENQELTTKVQKLETTLQEKQEILKENELLKQRVTELEKQCCQVNELNAALEKAENKIKALADERLSIFLEKEELQQRVTLLQEELVEMRADGFVIVPSDSPKSASIDEKELPHPADKLKHFYSAVDKYDESIMNSFKVLEQQVSSFVTVYNWLDETRAKLPSSSSQLSELGTFLEMTSLSLREAQKSCAGHRLQMEEASQQLGRLGSDFQTLLQEFLSLRNEVKNIKPEAEQQAAPAVPSASIAELEKQFEGAKVQIKEMEDKLTLKEKLISQLYQRVHEDENERAKLSAQQTSNNQSKELKEQLDHKIAEMLQLKDLLEEKENTIEKRNNLIAQKDSQLSQMELRVSQAETKCNQKEAEAVTVLQRMKTLEQSVDALKAQAEVYKMDFNEERESREKLAADKEKLADELLAAQQDNERLTAELEALKKSQTQLPSTTSASNSNANARTQHTSYNTIAAMGRTRGSWLNDTRDTQRDQPLPFEEEVPEPKRFFCPKCNAAFREVEPLQYHVETCLEL